MSNRPDFIEKDVAIINKILSCKKVGADNLRIYALLMRYSVQFQILLLLAIFAFHPVATYSWADAKSSRMKQEGRIRSLSDSSEFSYLKSKYVSASGSGKPLQDVLAEISSQSDVKLTASHSISEQRITLCVEHESLSHVMDVLARLLSHTTDDHTSHYWIASRSLTGSQETSNFQLMRSSQADVDQRVESEKPKALALKRLEDRRNITRLPKSERFSYKSDLPQVFYENAEKNIVNLALANLSDYQIRRLLNGSDVVVRADKVFNKDAHSPSDSPKIVTLRAVALDQNGNMPLRSNLFGLKILGVGEDRDTELIFDYDAQLAADRLPDKPNSSEKVYDLSSLLSASDVTDAQRRNSGFVLAALSKATGVNIYQEFFYTTTNGFGLPPADLNMTRGTVTQLLNAICTAWGYHAEKIGDKEYMLWSRTWAMDRSFDIPESRLKPWREKFAQQKGGKYWSFKDTMAIATEFTWPQVRIPFTIALDLKDAAVLSQQDYWQYRMIGSLSVEQQNVALSERGLPVATLTGTAKEAFWKYLFSGYIELSEAQKAEATKQAAEARLLVKVPGPEYTPEFRERAGYIFRIQGIGRPLSQVSPPSP